MADDFVELLDAVNAGFMADDVVLGLSRLQRGADVEEHHQDALDRAERALTWLADPKVRQVESHTESSLRQLVGFRLQAEEVVRTRPNAEDRTKFFAGLLSAFRAARSGQQADESFTVDEVIDFFEDFAQETQSLASGHVVTPAQPAWTRSALTGIC